MFKRNDILFILWMTFFTVAAWVGFHIYHIIVTSTISEELQMQIAPIYPDFDTTTINKIKSREKVEPLYQFYEPATENVSSSSASNPIASDSEITPKKRILPPVSLSP